MTQTDGFVLRARDAETLHAIKSYIAENGFPPTVREVGDILGLSSPSAAKARIDRLESIGAIEVRHGTYRGIRVLV